MALSPNYIRTVFFSRVGNPKEFRDGRMIGCCPICHEGNSYGKKRRLYYYPESGSLFCFNCQRSWRDLDWCVEVEGRPKEEILCDAREYGYIILPKTEERKEKPKDVDPGELPEDAINLSSKRQLAYYGSEPVISAALDTIHRRRLDTCVNRIDYYVSLKDPVHRNRLIIPFRDENGSIVYYQSRSLFDDGSPKYLSKGGDKTVFGIDKIDPSMKSYFVFEGPLDSCFVRNGLGVCGLNLTEYQESQLASLFLMRRIWVLDNDFRTNRDVRRTYLKLMSEGEWVFVWPDCFSKYKDINELCIDRKMDEIKPDVFERFALTGDEGCDKIREICDEKNRSDV